MTDLELLAEIAEGRTVAERLPLYKAAMDLGLITYQQIQRAVKEAEVTKPEAKPVAKKTAAKKAVSKN